MARMGPLRRTALFAAGVIAGALSITTGTTFGWASGLTLIVAAFVLVRRWWLPRRRR
jgi:hypothetical protein